MTLQAELHSLRYYADKTQLPQLAIRSSAMLQTYTPRNCWLLDLSRTFSLIVYFINEKQEAKYVWQNEHITGQCSLSNVCKHRCRAVAINQITAKPRCSS